MGAYLGAAGAAAPRNGVAVTTADNGFAPSMTIDSGILTSGVWTSDHFSDLSSPSSTIRKTVGGSFGGVLFGLLDDLSWAAPINGTMAHARVSRRRRALAAA